MFLAADTNSFPRPFLLVFALVNALGAMRSLAGVLVPAWRLRRRADPNGQQRPPMPAPTCLALTLFSVALCLWSLSEAGELAALWPSRTWVLAGGAAALALGLLYERWQAPTPPPA